MWKVSASPRRFNEAVAWFRGKVPIPEPMFRRLSDRAKQRAFFVSGVARLDLLADVWGSLIDALERGVPYKEWAARAAPTLTEAWGQSRAWRMETIFRTNVQHAYSAGRWAQLNDSTTLRQRPYWMYDAVLDTRTTEICRERNGAIRPASDPWWGTNWPPLHYNCRSGVRALTREEVERRGGVTVELPTVEPLPGFGAAPDALDWEGGYAQGVSADLTDTWESAFVGPVPNWQTYKRPKQIPARQNPGPLLPAFDDVGEAAFIEALQSAIGRLPLYVSDPTNSSVVLDSRLLDRIPADGRERYLAWLPDIIQSPQEIWLVPMRRVGGNSVVFRVVYVASYRVGRRVITVAAEFHRGILSDLRVYSGKSEPDESRRGILRYVRGG